VSWYGAIDVGGTKVAVGLVDAEGRLVASEAFPTVPERGPAAVVADTVAALGALAGEKPLRGVGLACVGPLDLNRGLVLSPPNFPGWDQVPIVSMLADALGVPVALDNDANLAALAEQRFGAGQGAEVLLYVTVSTGIGGGIVIGGQLLRGLGGAAGEIGHQTLRADGPPCGCGNRGCLEALASGTAIAREARKAIAAGRGATMLALAGTPEALHAGHVAQAAKHGDQAAAAIWDAAMAELAIGLGNAISTLAPDRLVIGGGVAQAGEQLLAPLRAGLARHVKMVPIDQLDIRIAALGAEAGLHGAGALAAGRYAPQT